MREWLYVLVPLAVIFYFLIYPDQFSIFMTWVTNHVGWPFWVPLKTVENLE